MEIKNKMDKKVIYLADALVIGVSLVIVLWMIGYVQPLVIAPLDKYSTNSTSVLFSFAKADVILIDDNVEFSSPMKIYAQDNLVINLKPGKYYWKVEGVVPSEIRMLQIESDVNLMLKEGKEDYEVTNAGNVGLDVKVYSNGSEIRRLTLDSGEGTNFSGDKVVGGQNV